MDYRIDYEGLCIQGLIRKNNEDNICVENRCLPIIHTDDISGLNGKFNAGDRKQFAVFDGMGGEACGEVASHLAARAFSHYKGDDSAAFAEEAENVSREMNRAVMKYSVSNHIGNMGSTVAALAFEKYGIQGFNVGDSRCYRLSDGKLDQISTDHVVSNSSIFQGYLTRCIGISNKKEKLEPSLYSVKYKEGDQFLLCTDGLTKLVSDRRIATVLSEKKTLRDKAQTLKDIVLRKGGTDNMTLILFHVSARRYSFSEKVMGCLSWLSGN